MSRNPRKPQKSHTGLITVLILLMLVFIAGTGVMIKLCIDLAHKTPSASSRDDSSLFLPSGTEDVTEETEAPTETTLPVPEHVVSTATIVSTGDLLMHEPVFNSCRKNGEYDFESIFRYVTEDVSAADYAVANLETTLAGTDNGYIYKGYPNFNCPDTIVDGAKNAGFDMLLNANNHSYDTSSVGMHRTISVIRDRELDTLGIVDTEEEKRYLVKEINGINIGMICYTYETDNRADVVALNGLPLKAADKNLVNAFDYEALDNFYTELSGHLEAMKNDGAEATILYIHWGEEYQSQPNESQRYWAQVFADCGADVVIGTHPHVLQPMEWVAGTQGCETLVYYSLGNFISAQTEEACTIGGLAHFTVVKENGRCRVKDAGLKKLVTEHENGHYVTRLV